MSPIARLYPLLLLLLVCVVVGSAASSRSADRTSTRRQSSASKVADQVPSSTFLQVKLGPRNLDDASDASDAVSEEENETRKEDEVADDGKDGGSDGGSKNDGEGDSSNDSDNDSDNDGDAGEKTSRGSGFRLVLLPTILLGLAFTIYIICRWCKTRKDTVAFGQVDEYLSDFDGDESESAISGIEAASMSYSDGGSTQSPPLPLQRIPTPPPSTQAEDGEMI